MTAGWNCGTCWTVCPPNLATSQHRTLLAASSEAKMLLQLERAVGWPYLLCPFLSPFSHPTSKQHKINIYFC